MLGKGGREVTGKRGRIRGDCGNYLDVIAEKKR